MSEVPNNQRQHRTLHIQNVSSDDPAVGLCLEPYGVSRGLGVSYERGTPVTYGIPQEFRVAGTFLGPIYYIAYKDGSLALDPEPQTDDQTMNPKSMMQA